MKVFFRGCIFALVIGLLSTRFHQQNIQAASPDPIPALPGEVTERVYVAEYRPGGSDIHVASPLSDLTAAHLECATMSVAYTGGWPAAARDAFGYAVDIWETQVCSDVTITISATWETLGTNVLGSAKSGMLYRDFTGAPVANTWYPAALANKYAGGDIEGDVYDIEARFNSAYPDWYMGTDGNTPSDKWDLVSVVLHEIGHGLGFSGTMLVDDICGIGNGCWGYGSGYPGIYDRFTQDLSGHGLISYYPNPSTGLKTALLGQVYFSGPKANPAYGGTRVPLYSPNTWNSGSSYSHLDEVFNDSNNALMTYALVNGETQHNPGSLMLAIFEDMGWTSPHWVYLPVVIK